MEISQVGPNSQIILICICFIKWSSSWPAPWMLCIFVWCCRRKKRNPTAELILLVYASLRVLCLNRNQGCICFYNLLKQHTLSSSGIIRVIYYLWSLNWHLCLLWCWTDPQTSWQTTCRPIIAVWEKPWICLVFVLDSLCSDTVRLSSNKESLFQYQLCPSQVSPSIRARHTR